MNSSPLNTSFLRSQVCPTCGSDRSVPCVSSQPPAENLDFASLKQGWYGFFRKKVFFTYHRCARCGQLYSPSYFTDDALAELYGSMPDNTAGMRDTYLERTQQGYYSFLKRHCAMRGDYFELGPDVGMLTQFIAAEPGIGKMWLYEPNRVVGPILAEKVKAKAFEIRTEMKDFSAVPNGSLGVCVMVHVLDHLPDVAAVMRVIARKLRPDGYLLIVTHDERSLLARILRERWPAYCLQHPLLFNKRSTAKFLSTCGLEVVETRKSTNYFPATYLLKHLLFALGLGRVAQWNSWACVIPLKLGNIMTVARPQKDAGAGVGAAENISS